jgi:pimeloyl-ACP methyl ester carboxylesterase
MIHTHQTAPTQFVEANGIRIAYRRFGKADGVPLVFNQHFTGAMDHWDPAVTDGLAREREVILFNNAGVSSRSGEVPTSFEQMAGNAVAFIKALGLPQVDVLGFSIGGFVAQEITLAEPNLVRRLILQGTGPRSGVGMDGGTPEGNRIFGATYAEPDHLWLDAAAGASALDKEVPYVHGRAEQNYTYAAHRYAFHRSFAHCGNGLQGRSLVLRPNLRRRCCAQSLGGRAPEKRRPCSLRRDLPSLWQSVFRGGDSAPGCLHL